MLCIASVLQYQQPYEPQAVCRLITEQASQWLAGTYGSLGLSRGSSAHQLGNQMWGCT